MTACLTDSFRPSSRNTLSRAGFTPRSRRAASTTARTPAPGCCRTTGSRRSSSKATSPAPAQRCDGAHTTTISSRAKGATASSGAPRDGAHHAQLELAAHHEVDDLAAVGHAQAQLGAGVGPLELGDQARQQVLARAPSTRRSSPVRRRAPPRFTISTRASSSKVDDLAGVAVEHLARVGRGDVAPRAVEQLGAELALQRSAPAGSPPAA